MKKYDHKAIEKKWQNEWTEKGIYKADSSSQKPKKYILDMFPYPSGAGLHVGHPKGYIATDILSRFYRMNQFNVLHPMGWDAFGLPAEQFAIKNKIHPKIAVDQNVATFKEQLSIIGLDYDWSREVNTTDPVYYKWTQWAFLHMFKKGLAFESHEPINWCPSCKTGLANEDLEDGKCERCGSEVEQKPLRQWVLRITDYAERMLADLDTLDKWPESVKTSQRNWIGKSVGAEIDFPINGQPEHPIRVFTTRADTIFGATFIGISAGLAKAWLGMGWSADDDIKVYIDQTIKEQGVKDFKEKEKTGIYAGFKAINPATKEEVPVWITNYVLNDIGTGAIMGVPAHDERDFEFAKKYDLPIKYVIAPKIIDKDNPPQDGFEYAVRNAAQAIVYNPSNDTYLTLRWKKFDWHSIVLGGVEGEEDIIETARREVIEETGYTDLVFKKILGSPIISVFHAPHKGINRVSVSSCVLFELASEKQIDLNRDEHEQFDVEWISSEDFFNKPMTNIELPFLRERMLGEIWKPFTEQGTLIESGRFNQMTSEEAKSKITAFVGGKMKTTYKLKDWVFSRQRYWGEPIPLVHAGGKVYPIPESDLPLKLPEVENYEPSDSGESPLADISEWVNVRGFINSAGEFVVAENSPNGEEIIEGRRETNTMPQWAGSCWYYLRYIDPNNNEALVDKNLEQYWQPVDVYVGGMEHATRHLIYARFWHKFLFDIGVVTTTEPFTELHAPGIILAEDGRKMSKRWGNVVNPDDMVERFGADAFRLYQAFMGPFDDSIAWNTDGLVGTKKFLEKFYKYIQELLERNEDFENPKFGEDEKDIQRKIHQTIKKVEEDIQAFKFNTAVSSIMILLNFLRTEEISYENNSTWRGKQISRKDCESILKLLAPFAPHITEELWHGLDNESSIHLESWPTFDESKLVDDEMTIVIQVNGKVRGKIVVPADLSQSEIEAKAMENPDVKKFVTNTPTKIIYVQNKLINIVL